MGGRTTWRAGRWDTVSFFASYNFTTTLILIRNVRMYELVLYGTQ
jgi:hypothetical protein